ncbi:MAG TPA: Asp-tRNA(Asn)/Glu-tRNA(Gln) amidotransferase subunit GatC [Cyclobacteriaceae bacterium]|nr:Asp-tRNA(Asn)/Glu-tRNA(Gln) amidotransferase subunit GatC [Cyclobacteriaceae bacterium]
MNIDKATLEKIAHLARLQFSETEAAQMMQDMTQVLNWVEKLKELDTSGVEPITSMSHEVNMLREDVTTEHLDRDKALRLAPAKDENYFRVPKVIE